MTYRSSTYPARFLERTFKGLKKFSGEPEDKDKYKDKDTFIGYYIEDTTFQFYSQLSYSAGMMITQLVLLSNFTLICLEFFDTVWFLWRLFKQFIVP